MNRDQILTELTQQAELLKNSGRNDFQTYSLPHFIEFLNTNPLLQSILQMLKREFLDLQDKVNADLINKPTGEVNSLRASLVNSKRSDLAFCIYYLEAAVTFKNDWPINQFITTTHSDNEGREKDKMTFLNNCVAPIVSFLSSELGETVNAIYILNRYKALCEWHDVQHGTKEAPSLGGFLLSSEEIELDLTKLHLNKYLFLSGYTYSLAETNLPSGRIDNFALNIGTTRKGLAALPDTIVAEGKLFRKDNKTNRDAIKTVVNQVLSRLDLLELEEGYCIIYNKSDKRIQLKRTTGQVQGVPFVIRNNKRIYFQIINLNKIFFSSEETVAECSVDID